MALVGVRIQVSEVVLDRHPTNRKRHITSHESGRSAHSRALVKRSDIGYLHILFLIHPKSRRRGHLILGTQRANMCRGCDQWVNLIDEESSEAAPYRLPRCTRTPNPYDLGRQATNMRDLRPC